MSDEAVAGIALIAVPVAFNVGFTLLARRFDYPDVLRRPTHEVLERFRAGGTSLILIWWLFALSAVLFTALAVLLAIAVDDADRTVVVLGLVVGLVSVVQFLGLIRWPFLVPYLARVAGEAGEDSPRGQAVEVVFQAFNRYLGVVVGEHLGYLLTGAWSILAGVALIQADAVASWLGVLGVLIGPLFLLSLRRVPRALRAFRMEACGSADAGRLHPLVAMACGHRGGVPRLAAADGRRTAPKGTRALRIRSARARVGSPRMES